MDLAGLVTEKKRQRETASDRKKVHLLEKVQGGAYKAPVSIRDIHDPLVKDTLSGQSYNEVAGEIAILDGAHGDFEWDAILQGNCFH